MALPTTEYFENELRAAYETLCASQLATAHLSGTFRWNGTDVEAGDEIELDGRMIDSRELAQLLMIFSDSRVHEQAERRYGPDDSPPGTYYTAINPGIVHEGHKNRVGIYVEADGPALFIEDAANDEDDDVVDVGAVHVDHFYLREQAPDGLGSLAFALSAMVVIEWATGTFLWLPAAGWGMPLA